MILRARELRQSLTPGRPLLEDIMLLLLLHFLRIIVTRASLIATSLLVARSH